MIPVSQPDLSDLERRYLLEAFDSGWISSHGAFIERAEEELQQVTSAEHATVVTNGTVALHLALLAAGIGPGDEVIIPNLTYVATLNAVYYTGATPVIADIDSDTWCLSVESITASLSNRTRAIIAVDLYGVPADYRAIRDVIGSKNIVIIADAAESLGATSEGSRVGTMADYTTLSFFGNKIVTSGEGGAVLTNSAAGARKIRQLRNQGNSPTVRYQHEVLGFNYRMTNLSAAVLTAQLERMQELVKSRRQIVGHYIEGLKATGLDSMVTVQEIPNNVVSTPWLFTVRLSGLSSVDRDAVIERLAKEGFESRPTFRTMDSMPYSTQARVLDCPNSHRVSAEGISLPTYPGLSFQAIDEILGALRRTL